MISFERFKLKANPFRVVPAINAQELIWAGFPVIKGLFEKRILRSLQIPNSSIVLNWGDYGSGKTHAARYFCKDDVISSLAEQAGAQKPLALMINFPRGRKVIDEIYTQLLDKIDIGYLRTNIPAGADIDACISNSTDSVFIQHVLHDVFVDNGKSVEQIKSFLYGGSINAEFVGSGITRKLNIESDAVDLLSALFNVITEASVYSSVILWIDEFEDIALQNLNGTNAANSFIKLLLDKSPNHLLMFINFTLSAIATYDDLGDYLQEAVKSRIVQRIELGYPNTADVLSYISDLMNNPIFREEAVDNPYHPFDAEVVATLVNDIGSASLRRYNEAFSRLLDMAAFDQKDSIDMTYYLSNKAEVIVRWKDE